jgi:uncharacterized protein (TIRG00374 family)
MPASTRERGPPEKGTLERRLRQAIWITVLAVVGYLALVASNDPAAILRTVRSLDLSQWCLLLGLSLCNYALRFVRWQAYLQILGQPVALGRSFLVYLAGFAFTITPGKAGEAARSVFLRRDGVPWSASLAALAVERILDLLAIFLLALLLLPVLFQHVWVLLVLIPLVLLGLFGATRPAVLSYVSAKTPDHGRLGGAVHGFLSTLERSGHLLRPGRLIGGLIIGLLAWGAEAYGFFLLLGWLNADPGLLNAVGIYGVSVFVGALSFLPGGLGGTEAVMIGLLLAENLTNASAILATVVLRAVTLWFGTLIGLSAVLGMGLHRRKEHEQTISS